MSMIPAATRLILVRHGQSTFNVAGRLQGCCDEAGLTRAGEHEARRTGERLADRAVDRIYCSPLVRARRTAEIIGPELGNPELVIDDRLREVDIPAWEGVRGTDLERDFPREFDAYVNRPEEFSLPGSGRFPWQELYRRAGSFLDSLMREPGGGNVLIVSHGGTIRALVHATLGLSIIAHNLTQQSNCGISEIGWKGPSAGCRLHCLNDTWHLGRFPPKIKSAKSGVWIMLAGVAENAGLQEWTRQFPGIEWNGIWVDQSCIDGRDRILPEVNIQPVVFDCADLEQVSRIAASVRDLRAHTDRLSTLGLVVRRPALGGLAGRLLGMRAGLLGQIADDAGAGVVIHDSAGQASPIIQAVRTW